MAKKDRIATEKPMLEKFYLHIGEEVVEINKFEYDDNLNIVCTAGPFKFTISEDDYAALLNDFKPF